MRARGWVGVLMGVAAMSAVACGSAGEPGGSTSSDRPDSGGAPPVTQSDAGTPVVTHDAGASSDASTGPTGLTITVPCTDTMGDVYVTPPSMPAFSANARGDIVRCGHDTDLSLADVASQLGAKSVMMTPTSGAHIYRIAYRTTRGNGAPGVSTARLYLPDTPRAPPLPLILVAHPTEGLASSCAPSKDPASLEDQALPWASLGYAVIAPDYAGLGNDDTVQGYVDNHDTGYSALDATRALRKILPGASLTNDVLAVGWSQGGGAVLSAQALEKTYGAAGKLKGVIAFAPEWPTRDNSFGYRDLLENPNDLTITKGVSFPTVAAMREYAYFSAYVGADHATDAFPAAKRAGVASAITSLCQTPFGGYLQGTFPKVGDQFDPAFHDALLACMNGTAGCVEPAKSYHDFMQKNVLTADATGAPILFIQGIADTIMPAASEAACNIDKLHADGVQPQVCTDLTAVHTNVVPRNIGFALSWGQAILEGSTLPACPQTAGMPPCTP
jgi:dienelactone hydrolase